MLCRFAGPGRPAHNAHPQSCSGEPIHPDEVVKREKDKREKKIRKQLERQAKRLQQSKQKPGVNTATLNEAIQQSLTEIRAINYSAKDPEDLVGSELHALLIDALGLEVCNEMLKKVLSSTSQHHQMRSSSPMNFANFNAAAAAAVAVAAANLHVSNGLVSKNHNMNSFSPGIVNDRPLGDSKTNPFSIDNLLSSRHVSGSLFSAAAAAAASITQPAGFLVNHNKSTNLTVSSPIPKRKLYEDIDDLHSDNEDVLSNSSYRSNVSDLTISPVQNKRNRFEGNEECANNFDLKRINKLNSSECNPTDLSTLKNNGEQLFESPCIDTESNLAQILSLKFSSRSPDQTDQSVIGVHPKLSRKFSDSCSESSDSK